MYGLQGRRYKYARKGTLARQVTKSSLRRLVDAANNRVATSDRRQLAAVVRKYRVANPYQITPASGRTVTFWRKVQISYQLGQTTGFQGAGKNVNFGFSLGRLIGFTNGVFTTSVTMPNASEFQALFDYYKVSAVKMQIFFTKNTSDTSGGSTLGMPLMLICNDFDDIAESMTRDSMMERVGCRHVQFNADNLNGISHYVKPKPTNVVVQTDVSTGAQSTSNAGVVFGTQWLDCASSNIVHNGIKVLYDEQGLTSALVLGNVTFVFDVCYEFKGYR